MRALFGPWENKQDERQRGQSPKSGKQFHTISLGNISSNTDLSERLGRLGPFELSASNFQRYIYIVQNLVAGELDLLFFFFVFFTPHVIKLRTRKRKNSRGEGRVEKHQ